MTRVGAGDRPSSGHRRWLPVVPGLDGVRGAAVLIVVVGHAWELLVPTNPLLVPARNPVPGTFVGVDLFFVLSGLLITSLLLREFDERRTIALGTFLWHRVVRLVPALWVLLIVQTLYAWAAGLSMADQWNNVRLAVVYLSNWAWYWVGLHTVLGLGHLWSLAIEFQFYLVWPIIVFALLKVDRQGRVLLATTVAGFVLVGVNRAASFDDGIQPLFLFQRTDCRVDALLAGAVVAQVWWRWPHLLRLLRIPAWIAVAGYAVVIRTTTFLDARLYEWGFTLLALGGAAMMGAIVNGRWLATRALETSPMRLLGKISYGLYLWHLPIFAAVLRYGAGWGPGLRVLVGAAVSAAATAASWRFVETPARRFGRDLFDRSPTDASPPSTSAPSPLRRHR